MGSPQPAGVKQAHASMPFQLPTVGARIRSPLTDATYTIGPPIGEGGFGLVFACRDIWDNSLVAKVIKPNGHDHQLVESRARCELDALAHVRHPNIVYVHDAFVFQGACYIVSERCGATLREWFADPTYKPSIWFRAIARCILQAVHFAHVQGLVHCDIHLGNVFSRFVPDEIVPAEQSAVTFKLGDFGLARPVSAMSAGGTFLNSIRPPEAIDPREFGPVDHRADIYQVGLVLLQSFLGKEVAFTQDEILAGIPRSLASGLPSPISAALERTLRRHVTHRTPSALDIWRDLDDQA